MAGRTRPRTIREPPLIVSNTTCKGDRQRQRQGLRRESAYGCCRQGSVHVGTAQLLHIAPKFPTGARKRKEKEEKKGKREERRETGGETDREGRRKKGG